MLSSQDWPCWPGAGGALRLGSKLLGLVLFAALPVLAAVGLAGCSGTTYYDYPQLTTPVGSYTFTVVATSSTGTVESIPITLQVGAQWVQTICRGQPPDSRGGPISPASALTTRTVLESN